MSDMTFDSEQDLVDWIKKNSIIMFGEELKWYTVPNLNVDLLGTDNNGKSVIVEVKYWKEGGPSSNRDKQEYHSVGQILYYANIFQKQYSDADIRLFIISNVLFEKVKACCEFLRAYGFDIQHLSVLEKRVEKIEEAAEAAEKAFAKLEEELGVRCKKEMEIEKAKQTLKDERL